jgi:type III secretion protein D
MKQLRILTGRHAGARLRLVRQHSTLGKGPEADLQIADWNHQPVTLTVEQGTDVVRLSYVGGSSGQTRETVLDDLVPRRFDDIVLCVGPSDDAAWPADVELMSHLLKPKHVRAAKGRAGAAKVGQRRRGGAWALAGGFACTVMLAGFSMLVAHGGNKAEARVSSQPLQLRVSGALARAGFDELKVREAGRRVAVEGLVNTNADLARVHALMQPFGETAVLHKYAAASDIAQSIVDALADSQLTVKYEGHGVFTIEGRVIDVSRLRDSARRIASDLGPMIKRIDVAVTELPPPQRVKVDSMLVAGDVRYVQTRDGTKHLIVTSPENGRSATSDSVFSTLR